MKLETSEFQLMSKIILKAVKEIESIINERKGKHTVTFNLIDKQNNYNVNLFSRKARVSLDRDFLKIFQILMPCH